MKHLEVSGAVRPLKWSLGVKWLNDTKEDRWVVSTRYTRMELAVGMVPSVCSLL